MARTRGPSADPKAQAARVLRGLIKLYPTVRCALDHRDPFELVVATVLSAQCTDERVNQVTPGLFARYPDAATLAEADLADVEALIYRTGFFRAKARSLVGLARALVDGHDGLVPSDLDALTKLPGVGRKTANVVLGVGFAIPSGVVVDTHVKRLAFRLGLTTRTDPEKVETDLAAILPRAHWIAFSHRLIAHGRTTCTALRPRCETCAMAPLCPKAGVAPRTPAD